MSVPRRRQPRPLPTTSTQPAAAISPWIGRFTRTERLLHWSNAIAFLALAVTGFGPHLPPVRALFNAVLARLPPLFGHPVTLIDLHLVIAMFFVAGPLVWILIGDGRALRADAQEIIHFDADDRDWLARIASPDGQTPPPPQGRFNAGQKLNALATIIAFGGFVATGVVLTFWPNSSIGAAGGVQVAGSWRHGAALLHDLLALVSVALVAGHIYLAALNPGTRHSMQGMLHGRVRRDWAREHHPKWVAAVEERLPQEW